MSISEAPRARVDASGDIWLMNGQTAVAAPTAPKAPVARKSISLRLGSRSTGEIMDRLRLEGSDRPLTAGGGRVTKT